MDARSPTGVLYTSFLPLLDRANNNVEKTVVPSPMSNSSVVVVQICSNVANRMACLHNCTGKYDRRCGNLASIKDSQPEMPPSPRRPLHSGPPSCFPSEGFARISSSKDSKVVMRNRTSSKRSSTRVLTSLKSRAMVVRDTSERLTLRTILET